jgi:hypothetical protein
VNIITDIDCDDLINVDEDSFLSDGNDPDNPPTPAGSDNSTVTSLSFLTPLVVYAVGVRDKGPLSPQDAWYLQLLLEVLAKQGKLSPPQVEEFKILIDRFNNYGLEEKGEKLLERLAKMTNIIQEIADKPLDIKGKIGVRLYITYIDSMVNTIYSLVAKDVKEKEYQKFKSVIGECRTREEAKKRFEVVNTGFVPGWVEEHWLRYQLEMIKEKLNMMKK